MNHEGLQGSQGSQGAAHIAGAEARVKYRFVKNENRPIEVLIFSMREENVVEFLDIDHEIWTLGEAHGMLGSGTSTALTRTIPFLSKEVWLDKNNPGTITMHFIWESRERWVETSNVSLQHTLQEAFNSRFRHPYDVIRIDSHADSAIYRYSRFERLEADDSGLKPPDA